MTGLLNHSQMILDSNYILHKPYSLFSHHVKLMDLITFPSEIIIY